MNTSVVNPTLTPDLQRAAAIPGLSTLLEVVAHTTGMGFVGLARVTETSWSACAVLDKIGFGLPPGGELELESTICNEIRQHHGPVVIDEVAKDENFCSHHTPARYGFQSYISFPIFLKNGAFFGTLCAIDPTPHQLDTPTVRGLFTLFTDLISFHLETSEELMRSREELLAFNRVASHDLMEPLRKIRLFTDKVMTDESAHLPEASRKDLDRVLAAAGHMQQLVQAISDYPNIPAEEPLFDAIDLRTLIASVKQDFHPAQLDGAEFVLEGLETIAARPSQLRRVLYNLVENALKFSSSLRPIRIRISNRLLADGQQLPNGLVTDKMYYHFQVADNGIGFKPEYNEKIFELFQRLHSSARYPGSGVGLATARRIVEQHQGRMFASGQENEGASFDIYLPCADPA